MAPRTKRILVLTPRYPYPVIGGDRLRIYQVCKALSKHAELTLLSLCETRAEMDAPLSDDGVFTRVERIYLSRWRSYLNTALALPTRTPLQIAYYKSQEYRRRVHQLLQSHDLCLAHLIRVGEYVREARLPTVLEMTDAISMNYGRANEFSQALSLKSLAYRFEAQRLFAYEKKILSDFDLVTLVSDKDADFLLGEGPRDNVLISSNGVDVHSLPFSRREDSEPLIAFIGNMMSMQNMDAASYFARDVLPLLRQRFECRFRVVGRITAEDERTLLRYPGVEVFGNVANIADAVGRARLGVAPIRIGAGIQNKILEYMALGLPAVVSSTGWEGLSARPGQELLIANTPDEYVEAIAKLWLDPRLAVSLAQAGRRYVEQTHDWSQRLRPLVERVEGLLGTDREARAVPA